MNIQLFDNKGDIYVCFKNAPKGTKEQLEKLFTGVICKELKGLVSEPEATCDIDPDVDFATKSSAERNENLPFQKKTKTDEKKDKNVSSKEAKNDGFEDVTENDEVPFEEGAVVKQEPKTSNKKAKEVDYDDLFA